MIKSYRNTDTEAVARRKRLRRLPADIQRRAQAKLMMLNSARTLNDLRVPPGNRLEALSGERKGQYSIRINDRWRICFSWKRGDAFDVEMVDYH
ncbi:MAG: type II toxin-antitoxin system RelE/ParE family toxin [Rhodospirillales bacterium]|nr:type II toxin-antitoxin system RelE/ParE family toxin [Rhodospirillales bacterium]